MISSYFFLICDLVYFSVIFSMRLWFYWSCLINIHILKLYLFLLFYLLFPSFSFIFYLLFKIFFTIFSWMLNSLILKVFVSKKNSIKDLYFPLNIRLAASHNFWYIISLSLIPKYFSNYGISFLFLLFVMIARALQG